MGFGFLFKKDVPTSAPAAAPGRPPQRAQASVAAPPQAQRPNRPAPSGPAAPVLPVLRVVSKDESQSTDRFEVFADLPKYLSVLTAGDAPIVRLSPADRQNFVVLELSGRRALIISTSSRTVDASSVDQLKGVLRTDRYSLEAIKFAPDEVIAEVYAGAVSAVSANTVRSGNRFLDSAREWVEYALENDATDIHMETHGSIGQIRFRIHGEIEDMDTPSHGQYPASFVQDVMAILYNNAQQKKSSAGGQFEPEKNLYCMVPFADIPGHSLKLRYQSVRGNEGPKVVMRLLHLNESQVTKGFAELGYAGSHTDLLNTAMNTPSGAVLFAGITGSAQ